MCRPPGRNDRDQSDLAIDLGASWHDAADLVAMTPMFRPPDTTPPGHAPYLGLHIGEVFYGNIGSNDRLDFTVVGPAVNEVTRIASMCRSVDRAVVLSSDFVAAAPTEERAALVSVGRFALRGVGRAQELFTLDPAARRAAS